MITLDYDNSPKHTEYLRPPRTVQELGVEMAERVKVLDSMNIPSATPLQELQGLDPVAEKIEEVKGPFGTFIEHYTPNKLEITTAFEQFNLPMLNYAMARDGMTATDRTKLAMHFVDFIENAKRRSGVLMTEGVDYEGAFARYGYESEVELRAYGKELSGFVETVKELPVYAFLRDNVLSDKMKGRNMTTLHQSVQRDNLRHRGVRPRFVFDEHAKKLRVDYPQSSA